MGGLPPYHYWGYNSEGNKIRDQNSQRSIAKDEKEAKEKGKWKGNLKTPNPPKGGGKGDETLTTVKETSPPSLPENKICALDGPQAIKRWSGAMFSRYYKTGGKTVGTISDCRKKWSPPRAECGNSEGDLIDP